MGEKLWDSLGQYISRSLTQQKGVTIPRFGTITFTSSSLSFEGVTNTTEKAGVKPIFVVSQDFAPNVRPGIATSTGLRPFTAPSFPKNICKLSFDELSHWMHASPETARQSLNQELSKLSEYCKTGQNVRQSIPGVGSFLIVNGIAAINFSIGSAGNNVHRQSENWLRDKLNIDVGKIRPYSGSSKFRGLSRSMMVRTSRAVKNQAKESLSDNYAKIGLLLRGRDTLRAGRVEVQPSMEAILNLQLPGLDNSSLLKLIRLSGSRTDNFINIDQFMAYIKPSKNAQASVRSQSTHLTRQSIRSDVTINIDRAATSQLGSDLSRHKMTAIQIAQNNGMAPRLKQAPSKILNILKKSGMNVNIHLLHAYMRDQGLTGDVSLLDLINWPHEQHEKFSTPQPSTCHSRSQSVKTTPTHRGHPRPHSLEPLQTAVSGLSTTNDPITETLKRLGVFLHQNKIRPAQLLKRLGGNTVSTQRFAEFLQQKVNKKLDIDNLNIVVNRIDMNKDEQIDIEDLVTALNLKTYVGAASPQPFPTRKPDTERSQNIVRSVRKAMVQRRLNYQDAFALFDTQKAGMLTYRELCEGLDGIISLTQEEKDGIFAIMDKSQIGMIDFPKFVEVLKDIDIEPKPHNDTWTWENEAFKRIAQWIPSEGLTVRDAFKAFDQDFDGKVTKKDLYNALTNLLKYEAKEVTDLRLDRLFKLLDTFKRGRVQLADFWALFIDNVASDWINSALQQLGLHFSRIDSDLKVSFDQVSHNGDKVTFGQFQAHIEKTNALLGFNLTNQLLQNLFAYVDPHKKGYINFSDWQRAFGKHDFCKQRITEVKTVIRYNFPGNIQAGYDYFTSTGSSDTVGPEEFCSAMSTLLPGRFSQQECLGIWNSVNKGRESLTFEEFREVFETKITNTSPEKTLKNSKTTGVRSFRSGRQSPSTSTPSKQSGDIVLAKIQQIIKASPQNIEDIFYSMDSDGSGKLDRFTFRSALRKMQLGLTSREMDELLNTLDSQNNGKIDWKNFCTHLQPTETQQNIKKRVAKAIQKYSNLMHGYMLSPKDAFHEFDPDRTGYLTFASFQKLMNKICQLGNYPLPSLMVCKDIFAIIDHRKDDLIDLNEWQSVFCELSVWEETKQFEEITRLIARNRKVLQQMSQQENITYGQAKTILVRVLRIRGLTDSQWMQIIKVADVGGGRVDFRNLLEIYKERDSIKQMHPGPPSSFSKLSNRQTNI